MLISGSCGSSPKQHTLDHKTVHIQVIDGIVNVNIFDVVA